MLMCMLGIGRLSAEASARLAVAVEGLGTEETHNTVVLVNHDCVEARSFQSVPVDVHDT